MRRHRVGGQHLEYYYVTVLGKGYGILGIQYSATPTYKDAPGRYGNVFNFLLTVPYTSGPHA